MADNDPFLTAPDDIYGVGQQQAAQIRANGQQAADISPVTFAQQRNVAMNLGLPTAAVTNAPAVPNRVNVAQTIDNHTQGAPVARQAYTNPEFTGLAHDDSHNVGLLDRFMQVAGTASAALDSFNPLTQATNGLGTLFGYKPGDLQASAQQGFVSGTSAIVRGIGALSDIKNKMLDKVTGGNSAVANMLLSSMGGVGAIAGGTPGMSDVAPVTSYLDTKAQALENSVQEHGRLSQAATMVGGLVPFLIAGEGAPLAMALSGAGSQAEAAQKAGKYGTTASDVGIVANAGFQALIGHFLGGEAFAKFAPQIGDAVASGIADRLGSNALYGGGRYVAGAAGELAQGISNLGTRAFGGAALGTAMQLGSNVIERESVNPEKSITDGVAESAGSMALLDLGLHALRMSGNAMAGRFVQATQGEADANILDGLHKIAEASKVRERAPDVWQSYLQQVTEAHGAPDSVYVSPEAFAKTFGTPEGQAVLGKMPEAVRDAVQISAQSGGDVKIPIDEFGTHVAGSNLYEQLSDHVKLDPNAFTRAEAADVLKTEGPRVLAELDRAVKSKASTDAFAASRDNVEATIKGQLDQAGRASPEVNAINAKLGAHSVATMAARTGMTPEEFHAEHGFTVGDGEARTGSQALDQSGTDARGQFIPDTNTINLLKSANLSSFLHELGHYHLETLAKFSDAHEDVGKDFDKTLNWFAPDMTRDKWNAMGFEERRPFHEQFARGFERYLFEGNAPTRELRSVFQRMSAWLKNVYRSIAGLNVELSPEVRGVMDRLVATPEDISKARADMQMTPYFTDKPAAMTDDQWASYQRDLLNAQIEATETLGTRSVRDLQWFEGAKSEELRKLQERNASLRAETRAQVTTEVMAQPVEQAREFLRFGRVNGEEVEGPRRLDVDAVDKLLEGDPNAEAIKKALGFGKHGMLGRENAIDPELVAERYGYNSAREMIDDLANQPKLKDKINDLTDQRMLEQHGDLTDPAAMMEAATQVVHNDAQAKVLETEINTLTKAVRGALGGDLVRIVKEQAREMAAKIVNGLRVDELKSERFRAEERWASGLAEDAAREGGDEKALDAKRRQLLNFYLAKATDEARETARKQVDYLKGFAKKSRRERIGTDIELIDAILGDYDLRANPNDNVPVRQQALRDWHQSALEAGYEPHLDENLLNPAPKRGYRDLTVSEMTGLHDTVKSIADVARNKNTVMRDGKKIEIGKAVEDLMAPMIERGEHYSKEQLVEPPSKEIGSGVLPIAWHKLSSFFTSTFRGDLLGQDFKANRYDMHQFGGPFQRLIFDRLTDRNYWKNAKIREVSDAYMAMSKELGGKWQDAMHDNVPNTELLDPKTGKPYLITRARMLRMATHTGNESNFRKMTDGWGWDAEATWSFLKQNMTAQDWKAAQFVMDQFKPLWEEQVAMLRRLGGVLPEGIEPRPFEVTTPVGTVVKMEGGYSPISYDPLRSKLADRKGSLDADRSTAIDPASQSYRATTTSNGALKNRAEGYTDVVNLDWHDIARNVRDTIHDLAYREALIDVNKVLTNDAFTDQFKRSYGPDEYAALRKLVDNIANLNKRDDAMSKMQKFIQYLRAGVIINGIGYRVSTVMKHGSSAALKSLGYVGGGGEKYFLARAARMGSGNMIADIEEARAKFPEIASRSNQMDRDFKNPTHLMLEKETLLQKNERYGHAFVAWSDLLSAAATAHAAYDWAVNDGIPVNQGGTGKPMEHEAAVRYANKVVREAHGSALETTRSNFLHDRGVSSLFGTMYGFMNNSLGQLMDVTDKGFHSEFSKPVIAARLMATMVAPAMMAAWVSGGGPSQDESTMQWMGMAIAGELAGTVPLVRDAWKSVEMAYQGRKIDTDTIGQLPVFKGLGLVIKVPADIYQELSGKDSKIIQDSMDALGIFGHVSGAGQLGHMLQYQRDVNSGKVYPDDTADYAKHLVIGGRATRH